MLDEKKKFIIQRCFYTFVGVLTMIPILLFTFGQMQIIKREDQQLIIDLLLLVHSAFVICSIISTAIFTRVTDALSTSFTIFFLLIYTGLEFSLRYFFDDFRGKKDFTIITFRLSFVIIMLIVIFPWTISLVYSSRQLMKQPEKNNYSRNRTFSLVLNLDWILMISFFILNIRKPFHFLTIAIPLILLWFILGKLLANEKCQHWMIWMIFYIVSLIEIFFLVYLTYLGKLEYDDLITMKSQEIPARYFLLVTLICGSTNVVMHFFLMIISASISRS